MDSAPNNLIDTAFDFRSDTPDFPKRDPDAFSPMLRKYHKILWSKELPSGKIFYLNDTNAFAYLHHKSDLGEFSLSSDTTNSSYKQVRHLREIRSQISEEKLNRFRSLVYTIGNMILFPAKKVNGKWTINQARGCYRSTIGDRFDLTLECIRRFYNGESSPLAETFMRYINFFGLFGDFRGYVDFFLLNDLVTDDYSSVNFFLPFIDFGDQSPYPSSVGAFDEYIEAAASYITARNWRIHEYAKEVTVKLD